jgi:hypothetical protein
MMMIEGDTATKAKFSMARNVTRLLSEGWELGTNSSNIT